MRRRFFLSPPKMARGITSLRGRFGNRLFAVNIKDKKTVDVVHVPEKTARSSSVLIADRFALMKSVRIAGLFPVRQTDSTGEQRCRCRLSYLKRERGFFGAFQVAQHGGEICGLHARQAACRLETAAAGSGTDLMCLRQSYRVAFSGGLRPVLCPGDKGGLMHGRFSCGRACCRLSNF